MTPSCSLALCGGFLAVLCCGWGLLGAAMLPDTWLILEVVFWITPGCFHVVCLCWDLNQQPSVPQPEQNLKIKMYYFLFWNMFLKVQIFANKR